MSRERAVLLVGLLALSWTGGLHLRATFSPPPGRAFVGTFHWVDDFYNYLSYARQAEEGQLLFRNRLAPPAPGVLLNAEWLLVGNLSRGLGGRPLLAYGLFGALATLTLLLAAERWLARLQVPPSHRPAALLLVAFGGGAGGLLFELTDLPVSRCGELSLPFFPFLEIVGNPHFVAGTALLLGSVWLMGEQGRGRRAAGLAAGSLLALVRPYDTGLLIAMHGGGVLLGEPRSRWRARLTPLLGLAPALAYDVWVFFGTDEFASFRQGGSFPGRLACAAALGPAAVLAVLELRRARHGEGHGRARTQLWIWILVTAALVAAEPGGIGLQLFAGAGLPLLLLGAAALAERRPALTALAALLLGTSAVVETRVLLQEDPNWFVARERLAAADALRSLCRPGDRVFAPADIGLFALGLSSCDAFVSHPAAADYASQTALVRDFYSGSDLAARSTLLDRERVTHLVLPGWAGQRPSAWLGRETGFAAAATVGVPRPLLSIYVRGQPHRPEGSGPAEDMIPAR